MEERDLPTTRGRNVGESQNCLNSKNSRINPCGETHKVAPPWAKRGRAWAGRGDRALPGDGVDTRLPVRGSYVGL